MITNSRWRGVSLTVYPRRIAFGRGNGTRYYLRFLIEYEDSEEDPILISMEGVLKRTLTGERNEEGEGSKDMTEKDPWTCT